MTPRLGHKVTRIVAAVVLAGFSGSLFSGFAAKALGVSITIATSAGGITMALIVGAIVYRHGDRTA